MLKADARPELVLVAHDGSIAVYWEEHARIYRSSSDSRHPQLTAFTRMAELLPWVERGMPGAWVYRANSWRVGIG